MYSYEHYIKKDSVHIMASTIGRALNALKTLGFEYAYDPQGNLLSNYRRGVGEGRVNDSRFQY